LAIIKGHTIDPNELPPTVNSTKDQGFEDQFHGAIHYSPTIPVASPFRSSNQLSNQNHSAGCPGMELDREKLTLQRRQHRKRTWLPYPSRSRPIVPRKSAKVECTTARRDGDRQHLGSENHVKSNLTLTQLSARYPATEVIVPNIINGLGPYLSNMDPPMIARVKTSAAWREPIQAVTDLFTGHARFSKLYNDRGRKAGLTEGRRRGCGCGNTC
jgi:hypothetical protein